MGMKKNVILIVIGVIVIILITILIIKSSKDKPFNKVELSDSNIITNVNGQFPSYYDTIVNVAMEQTDLSGYDVYLLPLSDNAKGQFDGELKAHIRYQDNNFYLYTIDLGRSEAIEVLSHEVIHMDQYVSKDLIYSNNTLTWKGNVLELNSIEYTQRPWEKDAFDRQYGLIKLVNEKLYNK
jgi:hypothetical protein